MQRGAPLLGAPRSPGAALYGMLRVAQAAAGRVEEERTSIGLARKDREWEATRVYWQCFTTLYFCMLRIEEVLVEGFDRPEDQHPAEFQPFIDEERMRILNGIMRQQTTGPILLGNAKVSVTLNLCTPPEFMVAKSCPWPTIEKRVMTIVDQLTIILSQKKGPQ